MEYRIGEISKITNISTDRIRNYQKNNLLDVMVDDNSNYRYFTDEHILQINFIKTLQEIGLTFKEIKNVLDFINGMYDADPEQKLIEISSIFDKYYKVNNADKIDCILADLIKGFYKLSDDEYKKLTTPFAAMDNPKLQEEMYIYSAGHYISEFMDKLNLNPTDAYKYFEIALIQHRNKYNYHKRETK